MAVEDVDEAYEKSKHVHLSRHLRGLSDSERAVVAAVAEHEGAQAGEVYEAFHAETDLGYTRYSEIVNKLDRIGVISAEYEPLEGRGRSRQLELAYYTAAVMDRL